MLQKSVEKECCELIICRCCADMLCIRMRNLDFHFFQVEEPHRSTVPTKIWLSCYEDEICPCQRLQGQAQQLRV